MGTVTLERDELAARHRAFGRGRTVVAILAWVPLLVLYALSHTRYLRAYVPESKGAAVVLLIVVPFSWLLGSTLAYRWFGPRYHGLRCTQCRARLVDGDFKAVLASGRCPACEAQLLSGAAEG